jgi:hypothetical protein
MSKTSDGWPEWIRGEEHETMLSLHHKPTGATFFWREWAGRKPTKADVSKAIDALLAARSTPAQRGEGHE